MHYFKKLFLSATIALTLFLGASGVLLLAPVSVSAATPKDAVCEAVNGPGQTCDKTTAGGDVSSLVKKIIQILSVVAGIIAVIMIIVAGMKYITSGGDPNKVTAAKKALIYALIGLVIVALAQFMVKYVLSTAVKSTTQTTAPAKKP